MLVKKNQIRTDADGRKPSDHSHVLAACACKPNAQSRKAVARADMAQATAALRSRISSQWQRHDESDDDQGQE